MTDGRGDRRRGYWILLALWAATAGAIDLLSPEEFTSRGVSALRAAAPDATIAVVAPLHVTITSEASGESTFRLDNAYGVYKSNPEAADDIIERYVAGAIESAKRGDKLDRTRIVPMVKDRGWLDDMKKAGSGAEVVVDVINDDLVIAYAEDAPHSLSYFAPDELAKAGVDRAGLRQLAAENLVRILPDIERRGEDGVYKVSAGGDFEASLLAIGTVWRKESFDVKGDFVFAVPARHLLYVTGSDDKEGIAKVRELAAQAYRDSTYRLTPKLFVLRGNTLHMLP